MTDTLTRQNPLLKSIAAFFVIFGVLPVLVITFGLVFLNSNFSMYHFNTYYLILSIVCSTPIYFLYRKRKSYKIFNDGVLFLFASITAVLYVTEDELLLLSRLPSIELQMQYPYLFPLVLFKLNVIIACSFAKTIITFHEWKEVCKSEITTSFRDSVSNAMDKIPTFIKKSKFFQTITNMNNKKNEKKRNDNHIHRKDKRRN
ncbi:hypothetical protein H6H58_002158 [Salmonella enterica]|nr:hypothetical protein [Salmonella enterica]